MIKIETDDYFKWLCSIIDDQDFNPSRYTMLLSKLHQTYFVSLIEDDGNRAINGIELRAEHAELIGLDPKTILIRERWPCTIFELMVALARICETQIMEDLFCGKRIGRWFKAMLSSLGLKYETDEMFDEIYVQYILDSFLSREYEPNGDGSLFKVVNTDKDFRKMEIWSQMNAYLLSIEPIRIESW